MASSASHPFYPQHILLPGYQPQLLSYPYILGVFFSTLGLITAGLLVWAAGKKYLSGTDKFLMCWFAMCGFIHFVIEGTVVVNNKFYQDTTGNILNEIWKEYAKADSRYATRDAFVIQMEAVTAFAWGPLSLIAAYGIATSKAWRFSLMTIVSMGQLYGDVLYYLTCFHEGLDKHSRPEPLYFWFYFIIINSFWIFIPAWVVWRCCRVMNRAVAEQPESTKKTQ